MEVKVVHGTGLAPHSPVQVSFHPNLTSLRARHLRKPQSLPTNRVVGPLLKVQGWDHLSEKLEKLSQNVSSGTTPKDVALVETDRILHDVADLAEQEIGANTATELAKAGTRCRGPNVTWQSILKEVPPRTPSKAAAAK